MRKTKNNIYIDEDLSILELEKSIVDVLKENEIFKIGDLWVLNRKKLKSIGLKDLDINLIIIKLQLLGLDLNKKVYSKD